MANEPARRPPIQILYAFTMISAAPLLRRPLRTRFWAAVAVAIFLFYRLWLYPDQQWSPIPTRESQVPVLETNSTLGFGAIYVVSKSDSPRRHGLLQSANVTELDLTIPAQPKWTQKDLDHANIHSKGSLMAWLGHRHLLRQ